MKVFVSHASSEAPLAKALVVWLGKLRDIEPYYSGNLAPGTVWLDDLIANGRQSDVCLVLLSPDSKDKQWLFMEAGLTLGAGGSNQIVPVLYGRMTREQIPGPLQHAHALFLQDESSFDKFVNETLKQGSGGRHHAAFIAGAADNVRRLIKYGLYGALFIDAQEHKKNPTVWKADSGQSKSEDIPRRSAEGELVAVRATVIPQRLGDNCRMKFGVAFAMPTTGAWPSGRLFEFHSSIHDGRHTWSIYDDPYQFLPFNIPGRFNIGEPHSIELWLSEDRREVVCVGIDSAGRRVCVRNEAGSTRWRLSEDTWDKVIIKAWADHLPIRVEVVELEIHRA